MREVSSTGLKGVLRSSESVSMMATILSGLTRKLRWPIRSPGWVSGTGRRFGGSAAR